MPFGVEVALLAIAPLTKPVGVVRRPACVPAAHRDWAPQAAPAIAGTFHA